MTPALYHRGHSDKSPTNEGGISPLIRDELGVDWVSLTGKTSAWLSRAEKAIKAICPSMPAPGHGRHNYKARLVWPEGVTIYFGHKDSSGMVEIGGGGCKRLGAERLMHIIHLLVPDGRCTRLDICRDLRAAEDEPSITLIDDIRDACGRGCLCYVRTVRDIRQRSAIDQTVQGEGVYLGSTQSPRFVRCYDKGLEQNVYGPGRWVRFEAQLRDDHADTTARVMCAAKDWKVELASFLTGVVDFRDQPEVAHLARRPRCSFWERFCDSVRSARTRILPMTANLETWLMHLRRQYGGTLAAVAELAGCEISDVTAYVFNNSQPTDSARKNPVTIELAAAVRQGRNRSRDK